ncbi:MAG: Peptide methionine sulfoxide reductase, peptide-methionine (S)-S-oxide reductase [Microgenomates group bacterium GW2011_GWC1_38_14]|nr:MAG: Peptide methionine sulfoxide reductase, peptide-methionine (S)-S-oxide reductase [Microgenomates group bacterium GW2011_GWC1_38_14]
MENNTRLKSQSSSNLQLATFGGGCFWCTEAIFKRVEGVVSVESGYSGGDMANPGYSDVSSGSTGHAEAVQIEFDPSIVSFSTLLEIFWVTHDPTTLNKQGNDVGTQYKSIIFYYNDEQKKLAEKSKADEEYGLDRKVVTQITPFQHFYKAEKYHQNYYDKNQNYPYCSFIIAPKVKKLLEKFGDKVKEEYKNT